MASNLLLDDLKGSSDSEDADYVPDGDHDSGEDSGADDEVGSDDEGVSDLSKPKVLTKRKSKKREESASTEPESSPLELIDLSTESAKKHVEKLWKKFLADVERDSQATNTSFSGTISGSASTATTPDVTKPAKTEENKNTPEFFEFAGEIIPVVKGEISEESPIPGTSSNTSNEKKPDDVKPANDGASTSASPMMKRKGGLNAVLALINKKQKLSTLQKTKMDWTMFKKAENISEELALHNRSKNAYLEKKRFLERSDLRSFELEKNARLKKRKQ